MPDPSWAIGWVFGLVFLAPAAIKLLLPGARLNAGSLRLSFFALLPGIALTWFLLTIHGLFYDWVTTGWALSFDAVGVAHLLKVEKSEVSAAAPLKWSTRLLLVACLPVIGWLLYHNLQRPSMDRGVLRQEAHAARLYMSDRSCDVSLLRKLFRTAPALDSSTPAFAPRNEEAQPRCTVEWMQLAGKAFDSKYSSACVILRDGRQRTWPYCTFAREVNQFSRRDMRAGDFIPAQTFLREPSVYLRPPKGLVDLIFDPFGQIVPTVSNPDRFFREHLWRSIWVVFDSMFPALLILAILTKPPAEDVALGMGRVTMRIE